MGKEGEGGKHTFRSITRLIILGKPPQILIFNPRHPRLVFLIVILPRHFLVCLAPTSFLPLAIPSIPIILIIVRHLGFLIPPSLSKFPTNRSI